jgi:opacity protein-like surface antigen
MHKLRVWGPVLLAVLMFGAAPVTASAQGFVAPFIGFDYAGDSGCPEISECEDKNSNFGVAFGALGTVAGFEAEFGYAPSFFGEIPGASSSVLTFMTNVMVGPKIGAVRPYVLGGVGLVKTHVELTTTGLLETDNNSFGWDFGGGLMIMFGEHIGVRGDIRRFATFGERSFLGVGISNETLSFQRASAALVLGF